MNNLKTISPIINISPKKCSLTKSKLQKFVIEVLRFLKKPDYGVSVSIVGSTKMKSIHKQYFNDPSDTDCISFSQFEGLKVGNEKLLGDVFVCWNQVQKQAPQYGNNPKEELLYCIIHGILHLLGYDDITAQKRKIMFKKQDQIFHRLVKKDGF